MAKILAIDTATSACSVALLLDRQISEQFIVIPQSHTQRLLPMIDEILASHQQPLSDLDAIALTTGPGSFTGLRIGLGIVQGLAFGVDIPLIGLSSLEVMALSARRLLGAVDGTRVIPCLDARMQEVYWGHYQIQTEGLNRLGDDSVSSGEVMVKQISQQTSPLLAVGDGWSCLNQTIISQLTAVNDKHNPQRPLQIVSEFYPHAHDVAVLAEKKFSMGDWVSATDIQPAYIRNEVSWKKRQRIRQQSI